MERLFGTFARIVGLVQTIPARDMKTIHIRAVMFPQGNVWCAQCLEHDIATEAATLRDLKIELGTVLSIQTELALTSGEEPFASLPPAPEKYFRMFEQLEHGDGVAEDHHIELGSSLQGDVLAKFAYSQSAAN